MMNTIRALQAEVAKLKKYISIWYSLHIIMKLLQKVVLDQYDETLMDEPLWALDPYMMSEVFDTVDFKTELYQITLHFWWWRKYRRVFQSINI